ncbi:hypothetical protein QFC22_005106 [Naganishia vaughanmartiniae]|uniref:Uncharacterized protein n=1 Tax=Naganishia vaughanmartiniae TaxID=1424756 RepID=A0ACC2WWS9_9TREE|nr:hypothetical protein QFC22_005106 [Naganishia vaughanmartiniae]
MQAPLTKVDWTSLGQHYRTGLFLGNLMELIASGYTFALTLKQISRYITLKRYRQPRIIEQAAIYGAGFLGALQLCIHCNMVFQNGLSNYLQIRRMGLDDDWQMKSIWITSSLVWLTGAGLYLGFWRQNGKDFKGKSLVLSCLLALVFVAGASGFSAGVVRCFFPGNVLASVAGITGFPESFRKVKPLLYVHYGLILAAQVALCITSVISAHKNRKDAFAHETLMATVILYFKHSMVVPLILAVVSLVCFVTLPGRNLELVALLPFSIASLGSVISIFNGASTIIMHNQDTASYPSSSPISSFGSGGTAHHNKTASMTRVVIPVERVEVVQISDKDSGYSPRVGLNRLPYNSSNSTVGQDAAYEENEKVSLNRARVPSL